MENSYGNFADPWLAQQNQWTERGRATSVSNSDATDQPRRSVSAFGVRTVHPMNPPSVNWSLRVAIAVMVLVPISLCVHVFLPPVSHSKLSRLSQGATLAEAKQLLGTPVAVITPSAFGAQTWRYQVPLRFGWVDLFFDERGQLIEHNYERF